MSVILFRLSGSQHLPCFVNRGRRYKVPYLMSCWNLTPTLQYKIYYPVYLYYVTNVFRVLSVRVPVPPLTSVLRRTVSCPTEKGEFRGHRRKKISPLSHDNTKTLEEIVSILTVVPVPFPTSYTPYIYTFLLNGKSYFHPPTMDNRRRKQRITTDCLIVCKSSNFVVDEYLSDKTPVFQPTLYRPKR